MMAISSGGMPARAATAIAGGASSALAGVAPAPMVATTKPIAKNMIGSTPACPRHTRVARAVNRASVPLHSAIEKSSVTPMSVTIRSVGNPSSTALGVMPPRNTPTISAIAIDRMPTLIVVVQLSVTASTSAPTEIHARLISVAAAIGQAVPASTRTSSPMSGRSSSDSTIANVSATRDSGSTSDAQSLNFSYSSSRVNGRSGPPR